MIDYLETIPLNFDRYFTKIDEFNLAQNDMHRASFDLEKNLIQLGNIPKVILPSISNNYQPNLTISYTAVGKRAPVGKNYKKISKIVSYSYIY